jgi:hypothetical protein
MRNVLDRKCRDNQNTHFAFNNFFQKVVQLVRHVEKNKTKCIVVFPLQQRLRERTTMLRSTYTVPLVNNL